MDKTGEEENHYKWLKHVNELFSHQLATDRRRAQGRGRNWRLEAHWMDGVTENIEMVYTDGITHLIVSIHVFQKQI
jgi:hypothetical protein